MVLMMCIFMASVNAQAQTHTPRYISMAPSTLGYYEYLPEQYNNGTGTYPLIIFFCGIGELGDGSPAQLPRVLANGTPKQIQQGIFPRSFTVQNQTYRFIVLTPQFTGYPSVQDIDAIIEYAKQSYRVDVNRVYLTGLSWGGGMVWSYLSGGVAYAGKIAAALPVCGSADIASWGGGNTVALADVPVWATHNSGDNVVPLSTTVNNVSSINNAPEPPDVAAKQTIFNANGHDAWSRTYDIQYRENGLNAYEWMLQYRRNLAGPVPVGGLTFDAFFTSPYIQLQWSTASEINNAGFVVERSLNGVQFDSIAYMPSRSVSGGGASYAFRDYFTPPSSGVYYRLKQKDLNGVNISYSPIRYIPPVQDGSRIEIFPNPVTHDALNLRLPEAATGSIRLQLIAGSGQMLMNKTIENTQGSRLFSVPLPMEVQRGIYTLRIFFNGSSEVHSIRVL